MLNIGDVITIQYEPWSDHPITQVKKIVSKGSEGIWFPQGNTYSQKWDNSSPIYRAIGWGDKVHLGCIRLKIANKPYLHLVKILDIKHGLPKHNRL
jgi:hypothetical protein